MELDTEVGVIRIPQDKLHNVQELLQHGKKELPKKECTVLSWATESYLQNNTLGLCFLTETNGLVAVQSGPEDEIRLSVEARSDIEWRHQFSKSWNGVAMLSSLNRQSPARKIMSDTSGNWGCGAVCGTQWFQLPWSGQLCNYHIYVKELTSVVISVPVWGHRWVGRTVLVRSDNIATVDILNNRMGRNDEAMHLVRCLAFILARMQPSVLAEHIPAVHKMLADALSRNNLPTFSTSRGSSDTHHRSSSGPIDNVQARLNITALDKSVEQYFSAGLATSL